MNPKKFIQIFLLVLIIIGIGLLITQKIWVPKLVGLIIEKKNKEALVPQILNVDNKINTSNWKIYTNTEYGFELKHPLEWSLDNTSTGSLAISHTIKLKEDLINEGIFRIILPQDLSSKPDLRDQLSNYINQESNFTVDGLRSIREIKKDDQGEYLEYVSFMRNDEYFVMTFTWKGSLSDHLYLNKDDILKIFNQMLYTFKFTK